MEIILQQISCIVFNLYCFQVGKKDEDNTGLLKLDCKLNSEHCNLIFFPPWELLLVLFS